MKLLIVVSSSGLMSHSFMVNLSVIDSCTHYFFFTQSFFPLIIPLLIVPVIYISSLY